MGKVYLALRTHRYGALNVREEDVTKHTHVVKTTAKQHEYQVGKLQYAHLCTALFWQAWRYGEPLLFSCHRSWLGGVLNVCVPNVLRCRLVRSEYTWTLNSSSVAAMRSPCTAKLSWAPTDVCAIVSSGGPSGDCMRRSYKLMSLLLVTSRC